MCRVVYYFLGKCIFVSMGDKVRGVLLEVGWQRHSFYRILIYCLLSINSFIAFVRSYLFFTLYVLYRWEKSVV